MTAAPTEPVTDRERLLDAGEDLFYAYGVQAVGMDAIRAASGLPLKRSYQLYPSKDQLLLAVLDRRDRRWRRSPGLVRRTGACARAAGYRGVRLAG